MFRHETPFSQRFTSRNRKLEQIRNVGLTLVLATIGTFVSIPFFQSMFISEDIQQTLLDAGCEPTTATRIEQDYIQQRRLGQSQGSFYDTASRSLTEAEWTAWVCAVQNTAE